MKLSLRAALVAASLLCAAPAMSQPYEPIPNQFLSGKVVQGVPVAVSATTSTTIAAANLNRVGLAIQCSMDAVKVSEVGAVLTSGALDSSQGGVILATAGNLYIPQGPSLTAITAYSANAGRCLVTEYVR